MIRTAGRFDPNRRGLYFLAGSASNLELARPFSDAVLIAVNELDGPAKFALLERLLDDGRMVLIDSGVFNLAMEHARRHRVTMDEALRQPLQRIEGYDELFKRYVDVCRRYGDRAWGYIELDLGGRDQKRQTRRELHDLGLRPIPVYHPLNDGWEYFDELATESDRICCGNIVKASRFVRLRICATIHERKRDYPGLFVHHLGLTPNEWQNAYPIDSADSSSWLSGVRFVQGHAERAMQRTLGDMGREFRYDYNDELGASYRAAIIAGAYGAALNGRNLRNHYEAMRQAGLC